MDNFKWFIATLIGLCLAFAVAKAASNTLSDQKKPIEPKFTQDVSPEEEIDITEEEFDVNPETIADLITENPNFQTLKRALEKAQLLDLLVAGNYTLFAPSDAAFAKLSPEKRQEILYSSDKQKLKQLLNYHLIPKKVPASQLSSGKLATANGKSLDVKSANGKITVNNAKVVKPDLNASNGVVHEIDTVLIIP